MKKRIFAILFCFLFVFLAGCEGGLGAFFGGDEDGEGGLAGSTPISIDGAKVLSKPADYSFSKAVGEGNSANYYNYFSREVMFWLYNIYENPKAEEVTRIKDNLFKNLDDNGYTYGSDDDFIYYLYDSLRYTIKSVDNISQNEETYQEITLDFNPWKWTIYPNATDNNIFFLSAVDDFETGNWEKGIIRYDTTTLLRRDWTWAYGKDDNEGLIPAFVEFYSSDVKRNGADLEETEDWDESKDDFYLSPYYQEYVLEETVNVNNYFQDALEYATYMFVLGYDYVNEGENGVVTPNTEFEDFFNFDIEYGKTVDLNYGWVTGMTVGGWENNQISVSEALDRAKALYEEHGNYIGLTAKNRDQIARFIRDKVIGEDSDDTFTVQFLENGGEKTGEGEGSKVFSRNYETIINNVVEYACNQAPIGYTLEENDERKPLSLSEGYLVSQIADYDKDYFFVSYTSYDEDGNLQDDDSEMFAHIEAAEYQSMVIYPNSKDFQKKLEEAEKNHKDDMDSKYMRIGDIFLAFEYFEDPIPEKGLKFLEKEGLTITVGFRYFDHEVGDYTANAEFKKNIRYGKNGSFVDETGSPENPDVNWVMICDNDSGSPDIEMGEEVYIKGTFKQDIGDNVINPFVNGTKIDDGKSVIEINGHSKAREYYSLNDSSSYGVFGTLNPEKFKGEEGCDYIEIYFDINRQKDSNGVIMNGINYNFKVGLVAFLAAENAMGEE